MTSIPRSRRARPLTSKGDGWWGTSSLVEDIIFYREPLNHTLTYRPTFCCAATSWLVEQGFKVETRINAFQTYLKLWEIGTLQQVRYCGCHMHWQGTRGRMIVARLRSTKAISARQKLLTNIQCLPALLRKFTRWTPQNILALSDNSEYKPQSCTQKSWTKVHIWTPITESQHEVPKGPFQWNIYTYTLLMQYQWTSHENYGQLCELDQGAGFILI